MDDLISRQAAIEIIHREIYKFFDICEDDEESPITYNDMRLLELNKAISKRLKALPSVDAANRWIPCKERLPELEEDVLLFVDTCWYNVGNLTELDGEKTWCVGEWLFYGCDFNRVKAWMPLPEPYTEEEEDGTVD